MPAPAGPLRCRCTSRVRAIIHLGRVLLHVYLHVHMCMYIYRYTWICVHIYKHVYHVYTYTHYLCTYLHMYTYTYMYTRQVVGKDIVWFHAVIWPALLWSIGLPPPTGIFAHGFVTDGEGFKMSKSVGNVVDPALLVRTYGADSVRYARLECMLSHA